MRILWVAPDVPYPLNTGANVAIYNRMLEMRRRGHTNSLLAFGHGKELDPSTQAPLREICERVEIYPKLSRWRALPKYLLASRSPLRVISRPAGLIQRRMAALLADSNLDVVQIENSILASAMPVPRPSRAVAFCVNFHSLVYKEFERIAAHLPAFTLRRAICSLEARRAKPFELHILRKDHFDSYLFVSDAELRSMADCFPRLASKLAHIPIGLDLQSFEGLASVIKCDFHKRAPGRQVMFFGGLENAANQDAARWFAREIFPTVSRELPDATFVVVGRYANKYTGDLRSSHIEIFSDVDDVRPHLRCADLCVMPLRGGGGVRVKLLEAIAARRVVVTTTLGLEGVSFSPGKHVLVADSAEEFAKQCVEALSRPERYRQMSADAYNLLRETHSWNAVGRQLEQLYTTTLERVRR